MAKNGRGIISTYAQKSHYNQSKHGTSHSSSVSMSARPEFYSGRGARVSDLNSTLLEMIYDGVKIEYGDDAAASFVRFVSDFGKLSATSFLNAFYLFVDRDCTHQPNDQYFENDIDVGPDGPGREAVSLATIGATLSGMTSCDETQVIRGPFLRRHEHELQ